MGNTMVSQSWVDDVQARIREQSAEIERLKAQARGALAGLVEVGEVLSTDPKESPLAAARRIVAENGLLQAQLERLKPSGQVAEDEKAVDAALNRAVLPSASAMKAGVDAISRLAAKAQGYEEMKARDDAWKAATTCDGPEQVAARARGLREAVADANERSLRAEAERDEAERLRQIIAYIQECDGGPHLLNEAGALAEDRCDDVRLELSEALKERDAAVADNAALLEAIQVETVKECDLRKVAERNGIPLSCSDVVTDKSLWCARCRLAVVEAQPHPGAALLKEKQEQADTIKALVDVLEEVRARKSAVAVWTEDGKEVSLLDQIDAVLQSVTSQQTEKKP